MPEEINYCNEPNIINWDVSEVITFQDLLMANWDSDKAKEIRLEIKQGKRKPHLYMNINKIMGIITCQKK